MIEWLQSWLASASDGLWEHGDAITIESLDNPGWSVRIALPASLRLHDQLTKANRGEEDWIRCEIKDGVFEGFGDPLKLDAILRIFKSWVEPAS